MRNCRKCGKDKPVDDFEVTNRERDWRRLECKECVRDRVRGYAKRSREDIQEYKRQWHERNREKVISRVNEWVKNNPEKRRKNALAYYYRLQHEAIVRYGGYKCSWCGIDEPLVLCLDHVENNGRAHRKEVGSTGGHRFYKWLRDNDYPPGFQVLCMNCNHGKHRNGGVLIPTLKGRCNDYPERE
jgi:hypothetical protein